jgi:hypothetical protein
MTFLSTRRKPESNNGTSVDRGHAGRPNFHSGKWPFSTIYDQVLE